MKRICCIECSCDLSGVIPVLHFNHLPACCRCDGREIRCNDLGWHVTQLDIIEISVHDQVIQFQMRCESEGFLYLALLAIAIGKENVDKARLLLKFQTECCAECVAHSFSEGSRSKWRVADACF